MSIRATYGLYVKDAGGSWGSDIASDLKAAETDLGFAGPRQRLARTGTANFVLENSGQAYASSESQTDVLPDREIKWEMTYDGTTVELYHGWIVDLRVDPFTWGQRRTILTCEDVLSQLGRERGQIALQEGATADEIISAIVTNAYTPPGTAYDSGLNVFPTSAVSWRYTEGVQAEEIYATTKIRDVCASDWGRFFIDRNGYPTFHNRHRLPNLSTPDLTLSNAMQDMAYSQSASTIYNHIEVLYYPRAVSQTLEVLARLEQNDPPEIPDGSTETFTLYFRDPSSPGIRVLGKDMVTPVASTDWEATSDPQGEGDDETANCSISNIDKYDDRVEITVSNDSAGHTIYLQRLQIRGYAVRVREPISAVADDGSADKRRLNINAPLMSRSAEAQALANYLLDVYSTARHQVRNVTIIGNKSAAFMAAVRDLTIGDLVRITETQTGLSNFDGAIFALRHSWEPGVHRLAFDLAGRYDFGTPFVLDSSTLSSSDVLIY